MSDFERSIHVLSIDNVPKEFLRSELKTLFGERVKVTGSLMGDKIKDVVNPTIVLTSGDFLTKEAGNMFPNSRILSSGREISCKNLDKIITIPKNKKVLVVNHPKGASETTIESLINMGFDHLEYVAFHNESAIDLTDIDIAISPAMMHLCPAEIKEKIDIGPRTLSFSTLSKILKILDLEDYYLDKFLYQYNSAITSISYKLSEAYHKSETMRENFNIMLDEIDDGIISIDENEDIIYMNDACKKLLGFHGGKRVSGNIVEILAKFKAHPNIKEEIISNKRNIFNLNGKEIMVMYVPLRENEDGKDMIENNMIIMKKVDEIQKLEEDVRRILYRKGYITKYTMDDIIGNSKEISKSISIAKKIAKSESTVMITGESGTGKEVFAQAIHSESLRSKESFVAVNLASLPETLVESELFGYSDGAFTGARKGGRAGLFEQAHKGTIFIDEIGDISQMAQSRLLRVLQEKEVMRIGDNKIINIDIRFIAATNKDLRKLVEQGRFREDLYYRLNVFPIELPPLRRRKGDAVKMIYYFMQRNQSNKEISNDVMDILINYQWPGNVRELTNVIEYMTQISDNELITIEELPPYLNLEARNEDNPIYDEDKLDIKLPFGKKETQFILETLMESKRNNIKIGRKQLAELGRIGGLINFTEDKVRTMLRYLEVEGLVFIGRTKQGTIITERGETYLGTIGAR